MSLLRNPVIVYKFEIFEWKNSNWMKSLNELNIKISLNENRNIGYKWTRIEFCYISAGILRVKSLEKPSNNVRICTKLLCICGKNPMKVNISEVTELLKIAKATINRIILLVLDKDCLYKHRALNVYILVTFLTFLKELRNYNQN